MIKDKNKNHHNRRAEGWNSLFSLVHKHHFVKSCCYATTFHSPEQDFYFEKWANSCSICAETSCLIQSDLAETRWVFSTESQAVSQMHVRRAKLCVMASKQLLLPTLQPGCKCESKRKQQTDHGYKLTVLLSYLWQFLENTLKKIIEKKKTAILKQELLLILQELQPWFCHWSHTSLRSADAVPGLPRPCAENLILVLLHCWPQT